MSKRRASFHEAEESSEVSTIRSTKINRTISCESSAIDSDLNNDLTFSHNLISQVLTRVGELANTPVLDITAKTKTILDAYPERQFPMLHYQNQVIEIPLLGEINLSYNENFPYRREPISISTDVDYFLDNLDSFKIFKKVMIKNCHLIIIPDSFKNIYRCNQCSYIYDYREHHAHELDILPTSLLSFQCQISSNNNSEQFLQCPITEETLRFSNILLQKSNIWNGINAIISAAPILQEHKRKLNFKCFQNLFKCFQLLQNINIAVNVNSNGEVTVSNIFHDYFTA